MRRTSSFAGVRSPGLSRAGSPAVDAVAAEPPTAIPEAAPRDEPVTMAASVMLTALPGDATAALETYTRPRTDKVGIKFRAIGSAPELKQRVARITASQRFEVVVNFLRKQLKCGANEPLFVYINSTFAPSLDTEVGALHECFKIDDHLQVSYCMMQAFG
ncbi:ubiquitin-like autophagy protein Apg12-domain-containing protein [Dipodascopsis tothii]|uniref:ubiquitin-like autophagy protein Apg12-domain-containing protein n=1 Tax=Dipodascopsis tothii TaxID=44089 RepID=UPI0034CF1E59